jgi:hypothetical protein
MTTQQTSEQPTPAALAPATGYARLMESWESWYKILASTLAEAEAGKRHANAIRIEGQLDSMRACINDLAHTIEHNESSSETPP